jgi:hypothetical protein
VNTDPLPGSLVTVTSPPIMRASLRVIAQPGAPEALRGCPVGLAELLEQLCLLLRCHADPGVSHSKLDPVASVGNPARPERDLALLGELEGIAQQIEQNLPQPQGSTVRVPRFSWASTTRRFLFYSAS